MRRREWILLVVALIGAIGAIIAAAVPSVMPRILPTLMPNDVNLIVNGSFENPIVNDQNGAMVPEISLTWALFTIDQIPGWKADWAPGVISSFEGLDRPAITNIELMASSTNTWQAAEGHQYIELDSDWDGIIDVWEPASLRLYQDVPTCPNQEYDLSFAWTARPNAPFPIDGTDAMEVLWNGTRVGAYSQLRAADVNWQRETIRVVAPDNNSRLEFIETGEPDSLGMFLDDVRLFGPRC